MWSSFARAIYLNDKKLVFRATVPSNQPGSATAAATITTSTDGTATAASAASTDAATAAKGSVKNVPLLAKIKVGEAISDADFDVFKEHISSYNFQKRKLEVLCPRRDACY